MFDNDVQVLKKKQSIIDVGQRNQLDLMNGEIRRNKEILTNLRLENTQLNVTMRQAVRGQKRVTSDEFFRREEDQLHNKLCVLKRCLNSVKGKKEELEREIERTIEETNFTIKEGDATIDENSAIGQKIRALENRLDKCLIKHNEVNAIRRTYETLLERLQQEQAGFDTQLAAMEKTLQNKEKDLMDLNSVASEAAKGRDAAKAEVLLLKTQITKERRAQKKDIEERRTFVMNKKEQLEKRSQRLREKMEREEERRLRTRMALSNTQKRKVRVNTQQQLKPEEVERQTQLREAYHRLKEITMSGSVSEVIAKLRERRDANAQLRRTVEEAEKKHNTLKEERNKLQQEWDELQQQNGGASGGNAKIKFQSQQLMLHNNLSSEGQEDNIANTTEQRALLRRRILEEFDAHLTDRQNELQETQRVQKELGHMLLDLEAGVQHLSDKLTAAVPAQSNRPSLVENNNSMLGPIPTSSSANNTSINNNNNNMVSNQHSYNACVIRGEAVMETLQMCAARLRFMLEEVREIDVISAAKSIAHWRGALAECNTRVPLPHSGNMEESEGFDSPHANNNNNNYNNVIGGYGESESSSFALERRLSLEESKRWRGAGVGGIGNANDDFPENEIHNRNELKMMSIATVERERKKARKQLQQRTKEEGA